MLHIRRPLHLIKTVITAICFLGGVVMLSPLNAQTVYWAEWGAPDSYPFTERDGPYTVRFANGVTGKLGLQDGSIIDVTLSGEVLDESCFTVDLTGCPSANSFGAGSPRTGWWKTARRGWNGFPVGTFTSANVPNLPNNQNLLAMSGLDAAYAKHTLTFSQPVTDVVMNIVSLGGTAGQSTYAFSQDFNLLSQDTGPFPMEPLVKVGRELTGKESSGTIQFVGTFSSIEWVISVPEYFSGFNFGTTSAGTSSLTLRNQWRPGAVDGDEMNVATLGDASVASVSSIAQAAGNTDDGATVALSPDQVVIFPAPNYVASATASYSATLSCTNNGQPRELTGSVFPYQLTVVATDRDLVCEYVTSNATPLPTTGAISITKNLAPLPVGTPDIWPQDFEFTAICDLPTAGFTYTANVRFTSFGSQAAIIPDVPEGAVCSLGETQPAALASYVWDAAVFAPSSVTVVANQTSSSVITNRLQAIPPALGTILITKTLAPLPAGAVLAWPLTFDFTATCDKPAANSLYTTSLSFTAAGSQTASLATIPEGATCTLAEALPIMPSGYMWDMPIFVPGTVSVDGGQTINTILINTLHAKATTPVPSMTAIGLIVLMVLLMALSLRQRRDSSGERH